LPPFGEAPVDQKTGYVIHQVYVKISIKTNEYDIFVATWMAFLFPEWAHLVNNSAAVGL
jgi:hypothetical protein